MYNGSKIKYLTGGKSYLTKKDIPEEIKPFVNYGEWHLFELEENPACGNLDCYWKKQTG